MRRTLIGILAFVLLASCGEDEGPDRFVSAKIDGAMWVGAALDATLGYTVDHPDGAGYWMAVGRRANGSSSEFLVVGLPNPIMAGTYTLASDSAFVTFASCPNGLEAPCDTWRRTDLDNGAVTITDVNFDTEVITGTFYFTGISDGGAGGMKYVRNFTNGRFSVHAPGMTTAGASLSRR